MTQTFLFIEGKMAIWVPNETSVLLHFLVFVKMNIVFYPVTCRRACLVYTQACISKRSNSPLCAFFFLFYDFILEIIAGDENKTISMLLIIC